MSDELRVPIGIPVQTNAAAAAADVGELRDKIAASKDTIKDAAAAMRQMVGKTDEVKAAKDQLKRIIDAEKEAMTAATLKLMEHGASLDKVSAQAKSAAAAEAALKKKVEDAAAAEKDATKKTKDQVDAQKKAHADKLAGMTKAVSAAGGPVSALSDKVTSLTDAFGGANMGAAALAGGAAALVGVIFTLASSFAHAAVELGRFILLGADAARSAGLLRQAALNGRADWAENLGQQVDALAKKIPLAKDRIEQLGIGLAKQRIGGQTMVDTMNAVGQASAALGDDAGAKIQEFITRGKMLGNFQLNPQEMIGTGLDFTDVTKALAKQMKVGVGEAQKALFEGRVKMADGAAAMRKAVEDKFGGINAEQMLSFPNLLAKAKEAAAELTKGVKLEPALKALGELAKILDTNTVTGQALKGIFSTVGNDLVKGITAAAPIFKAFVQGMIIAALQIENVYLRARVALKKTFGDSDVLSNAKTMELAMKAGKVALVALGVAALMTAGFMAAVAAPFVAVGLGVAAGVTLAIGAWQMLDAAGNAIKDTFLGVVDKLKTIDWVAEGKAIVMGLVDGVTNAVPKLIDGVKGLGDSVKNAFRDSLGIHSPSKVFAEYGKQTAAGFDQGVDAGAGDAQRSVEELGGGASPRAGAAGGGAGGGFSLTFAPQIIVQGGGGDVREQLADPKLLEPLLQALLDQLHTMGIAVA